MVTDDRYFKTLFKYLSKRSAVDYVCVACLVSCYRLWFLRRLIRNSLSLAPILLLSSIRKSPFKRFLQWVMTFRLWNTSSRCFCTQSKLSYQADGLNICRVQCRYDAVSWPRLYRNLESR